MLILARRIGEKIAIGDNIIVTVIEVRGGKVRLGFEAERDIAIVREERLPSQAPPAGAAGEPG